MKITVRFGCYSIHPKDAQRHVIELPDDSLFYTAGSHSIGHCLHEGALHYIVISKASDNDLKKLKDVNIVFQSSINPRYTIFRMNGWAFISLQDCIIDEPISPISEDEFNNLIMQKHLYYVCLSENLNILKVIKINRIIDLWNVRCSVVRHRDDFDSGSCEQIIADQCYELEDIVHWWGHILCKRIDTEYGKQLFDDMCLQIMNKIDSKFKPNFNYDFDWLNKNWKEFVDNKEFIEILNFKKELPFLNL